MHTCTHAHTPLKTWPYRLAIAGPSQQSRAHHSSLLSDMTAGSCYTSMNHVAQKWVIQDNVRVMSRINESCHTSMSHVTHQSEVKHVTSVCFLICLQVCPRHVTYEWAASYTIMYESCHALMSHVTHQWVMSHIRATSSTSLQSAFRYDCKYVPGMSHTNESCHIR